APDPLDALAGMTAPVPAAKAAEPEPAFTSFDEIDRDEIAAVWGQSPSGSSLLGPRTAENIERFLSNGRAMKADSPARFEKWAAWAQLNAANFAIASKRLVDNDIPTRDPEQSADEIGEATDRDAALREIATLDPL